MCWSCHKESMLEVKDEAGHPFRRCPECGATDTDVPKPGIAAAYKVVNPATGMKEWSPNSIPKGRRAKK